MSAAERLRPHRHWFSGSEDIMQINLERGEWIQVCINLGTVSEPRYEIIEVTAGFDGSISLKANVPCVPWSAPEPQVKP